MPCNCARFGHAWYCPVHTQEDYDAAERARLVSGPGEGGGLAEVLDAVLPQAGFPDLRDEVTAAVHAWLSSDEGLLADEVVEAAGLSLFGPDYYHRLGVTEQTRRAITAALSALPVGEGVEL